MSLSRQRRLKKKRAVARERYASKLKLAAHSYAMSWIDIDSLIDEWSSMCHEFVHNFELCPKCGTSRFTFKPTRIHNAFDPYTRPALTSVLLLQGLDDANIRAWWILCNTCSKTRSRENYVIIHTPEYIRRLLTAPQLHTQLLSIIDISISVTNTTNAIAQGLLERRSLLDNPLISWSSRTTTLELQSSIIADVLAYNIENNPILMKYKSMAERPHKRIGLCILSDDVLTDVLRHHNDLQPFELMTEAENQEELAMLENLAEPSRRRAYYTTDTHEFSSIQLRNSTLLDARKVSFKYNGLPSQDSDIKDITIETAVFPFLFPFGHGQYDGIARFSDYIRMRMHTFFSLYTLYKPYLLLMYQLKHAIMIANSTSTGVLQRDIDKYKLSHVNANEQDIIQNIVRFNLPASIPGTPSWHRKTLKDLISMVHEWGLPNIFVTFTADEVTTTRWPEIDTIEQIARAFNDRYTWKDCPVECAVLFHNRLHNFMNRYIFNGKKILGAVLHHLIRYEIQNRGSMHAHVILWVHESDIDQTAFEIAAHIPATDTGNQNDKILRDLVVKKQMHICRDNCQKRKINGKCKYGFPYDIQSDTRPVLDPQSLKWTYYRPGYEHRNVVPYHPTVLLLWGAHMNIQRVTNSSISYYLLKYAMKCEPTGPINISADAAAKLGLQGLDTLKLKIIAATLLTKPVSSTEAALSCLQIPIISKSEAVFYVDSSPPELRQHILSRSQNVVMHPIDVYCARPSSLENVKFFYYHKNYTVSRNTSPNTPTSQPTDMYGNFVHQNKRLVRFTEYHPGHSTEAFFYNVLLSNISFRTESELLSAENTSQSYFVECQIRHLVQNNEDLEMYITDYTQRNMLVSTDIDQLITLVIQKTASRRPNTSLTEDDADTMEDNNRQRNLILLKDFSKVKDTNLTPEQSEIYSKLMSITNGLHVITGTPGSGKSHLIRFLTYHYVSQGKGVILTASTGAAATRLSSIAKTVHFQFKIPSKFQQYPLSIHDTDERYLDIQEADVIIIDEISMITKTTFELIIRQLVNITNGSLLSPFNEKVVILVGDLAQLPPVCKHSNTICYPCHITNSVHWLHASFYNLSFSIRHAKDTNLMQFLTIIRERKPTALEIESSLSGCILDATEAYSFIDKSTTIICTHRVDVRHYNNLALSKFHTDDEIIPVAVRSNAQEETVLQHWLLDSNFHELDKIAVNCTCMITENIDLTIGAANGATCTVQTLNYDSDGKVSAIRVLILCTNTTITLRRTKHKRTAVNGKWYHKSTFPLTLAYAMTGHKSQGATISKKVLLVFKEAFAPGLAYVMLSRITERRNLKIIGMPTPDTFQPIPIDLINATLQS